MYIAIMGYGTVGSGVAEVIANNHESIVKKSSQPELEVKYILDLRDFPGDVNEKKMIKDFNIMLEDDEIEVVAEVVGGCTFAYDYTKKLLARGKSVVTSNKELVAQHGVNTHRNFHVVA